VRIVSFDPKVAEEITESGRKYLREVIQKGVKWQKVNNRKEKIKSIWQ